MITNPPPARATSKFMPRQILITGVTSGIGRALVGAFAKGGDRVIGVARRSDRLDQLKQELGDKFTAITGDLSTIEGVDAVMALLGDKTAEIDVLVNNAGIMKFSPTQTLSAVDLQAQIGINLVTPIWLTRQILPGMITRKSGLVVNIASAVAEMAAPKLAAYSAAKAGLIQFTKTIAAEFVEQGIRAIAIAPGPVQTNLVDKFTMAMIVKNVPIKRAATVDEIANFIVYVASDAGSFITGSVHTIDGGLGLRL
jgi:NAD(P)-dependent dehydrogenase (short-subunit alcohol dehydrogenase family)